MLEAIVVIVVAAIATVAVKIAIKFDVNKWRESRRKILIEKLKATCPHTSIEIDDDGRRIEVISHFISPSMSTDWICTKCNAITRDPNLPKELQNHYKDNLKQWAERMKKFLKIYKRLYG